MRFAATARSSSPLRTSGVNLDALILAHPRAPAFPVEHGGYQSQVPYVRCSTCETPSYFSPRDASHRAMECPRCGALVETAALPDAPANQSEAAASREGLRVVDDANPQTPSEWPVGPSE